MQFPEESERLAVRETHTDGEAAFPKINQITTDYSVNFQSRNGDQIASKRQN